MPENSHINFDAYAMLRKWPSRKNRRLSDKSTYLVIEGTLDDCIREFMAKPGSTRHLYEVHTAPQHPVTTEVLSPDQIAELARLRSFL